MKRFFAICCVFLTAPVARSDAQATADSLRLSTLRAAAFDTDPRAAQLELLAAQSALRLQNISAESRPVLSFDAQGQYQSDVATIPVNLPGVNLPTPANDTYDARLGAQQRLYDPSAAPRRKAERAQVAESQARVRSALYGIAELVNTAFFTALRSDTQVAELETTVTDLEAQLLFADARVRAGTALSGESMVLRAEVLRRRQAVAEQVSIRRAAIAVLSSLAGRQIDPAAPLSSPDLARDVATVRGALDTLRNRPEYEQFSLARDAVERADDVRAAQDRPRLSAFGRLGYGRPGLNPLGDRFDAWWLAGVQLQWTPWNWGATRRERQIGELQRRILTTEEQSFRAAIARAVEQELVSIDRLESAVAQDNQIIALRESILSETRARYAEAVVTSADYVDRQTDVLAARLSRALHRVELSQARTRLLTTLGVEVR